MTPHLLLMTAIFAGAGLCAGMLHFVMLSRWVSALKRGGASLIIMIGAPIARVAATGGVLAIAALTGAAPLLSALGGFLFARSLALRRTGG